MQLPTLCQHAVQRAQQLQQTLQQLLAAGASSCEGAGGQQWQQLVQDMDAALQRQLQDMAHFDALYQQVDKSATLREGMHSLPHTYCTISAIAVAVTPKLLHLGTACFLTQLSKPVQGKDPERQQVPPFVLSPHATQCIRQQWITPLLITSALLGCRNSLSGLVLPTCSSSSPCQTSSSLGQGCSRAEMPAMLQAVQRALAGWHAASCVLTKSCKQ